MLRYVLRRIAIFLPVLLGMVTVVFTIVHLMPGDPARLMAGSSADPAVIANIRREMGFDRPLWQQYVTYIGNVVQGDFGRSYQSNRAVLSDLVEVYPKTMILAIVAETISSVIGLSLGLLAAVLRGSKIDKLVLTFAAFSLSFPMFWLALMLQLLFSVTFPVLPPSGYEHGFDQFVILPACTLALPSAGFLARVTRSALVQLFREEYLRTARAKGLHERTVALRHALPNAMIPVITTIGLDLARLFSGILIIEVIFAWPGVGKYAFDALVFKDLPALQASVIVFAVAIAAINVVVDLLYAVLDPRISYA